MAKIAKEDVVIRIIRKEDYDRIVEIDAKITGRRRMNYFRRKVFTALDHAQQLVTSLVAEVDGTVVGFIMGNVSIGEFGIPETTATIDTLGVDPDFQHQGIAKFLLEEFVTTVKKAGGERVTTQVGWDDIDLLKFFNNQGFAPAKRISLELGIE